MRHAVALLLAAVVHNAADVPTSDEVDEIMKFLPSDLLTAFNVEVEADGTKRFGLTYNGADSETIRDRNVDGDTAAAPTSEATLKRS